MTHDPLQSLFNAIDPVRDFSDVDLDELLSNDRIAQLIRENKVSGPVGWLRRRSWRRTVAISTSVIFVFAGTAAAITLLRSPVTNTSHLTCFSQDSVHSKVSAVTSYNGHPLASCQSQLDWQPLEKGANRSGFLCVLADGAVGGFPPSIERENCAKLGLPVFDGKLKYPQVLKFEESVHRYLSANSCASTALAHAHLLQLIGDYGLSGWRVRLTGSRSSNACATFAIQIGARIVDIVGIAG